MLRTLSESSREWLKLKERREGVGRSKKRGSRKTNSEIIAE